MPLAPIDAAWRTLRHVGPQKPSQRVRLQPGLIDHGYGRWTFLDGSTEDFGTIARSKHNNAPWHGFWRSTGDWIDLPNVAQVDIDQSFDSNGIATATIKVENIVAKEYAGLVGAYHLIRRGYLSPSYGWAMAGRLRSVNQTNEWLNVLNGSYRIFIEQGYGDDTLPSFTGLIDDTDIVVNPDEITITARDFGQLLTDQFVFGWNKAPEITHSPVVFADRLKATKVTKVSSGAAASSSESGYRPISVTNPGGRSYWKSAKHSSRDNTEWIEIHLPAGTYTRYWLWPRLKGMEMYVAVYGRNAKVDGQPVNNEWVFRGNGNVPGTTVPWVIHHPTVKAEGLMRHLPFTLEAGANTVLRIYFTRLGRDGKDQDYSAAVNRLVAYRELPSKEAKINHWILVDDAADVVKWVLMWCGFREWEVESFGMRIDQPMSFNQTDHFIDIINYIKSQGDYVFFMTPPSEDDSIGVPVFRHTHAVLPTSVPIERATDHGLITHIEPKWSKESLAYIIRTRGKAAKRKQGGVQLGQDTLSRYQATYLPPWSGAHIPVDSDIPDYHQQVSRLAGLRKHVVHTDPLLTSEDQCLMACLLIAVQQALAAWTATVELPGFPRFWLDDHLDARDETTGTNSRLWIASLHSTFVTGPGGTFLSTLGGSLTDTPDMAAVQADLAALKARLRSEAP